MEDDDDDSEAEMWDSRKKNARPGLRKTGPLTHQPPISPEVRRRHSRILKLESWSSISYVGLLLLTTRWEFAQMYDSEHVAIWPQIWTLWRPNAYPQRHSVGEIDTVNTTTAAQWFGSRMETVKWKHPQIGPKPHGAGHKITWMALLPFRAANSIGSQLAGNPVCSSRGFDRLEIILESLCRRYHQHSLTMQWTTKITTHWFASARPRGRGHGISGSWCFSPSCWKPWRGEDGEKM